MITVIFISYVCMYLDEHCTYQDFALVSPAQYDVLSNSTVTTLSSLTDLKFRSYFHNYSFITFLQLGEEEFGFTRYLPYLGTSIATNNPSSPSSCQISWPTTDATCKAKYLNSKCSNPYSPAYPIYDPRCRRLVGVYINNFRSINCFYMYVCSAGTLTGKVQKILRLFLFRHQDQQPVLEMFVNIFNFIISFNFNYVCILL